VTQLPTNIDPPWICPQCREDRHRACPTIAFNGGDQRRCECLCRIEVRKPDPTPYGPLTPDYAQEPDSAPSELTAAQVKPWIEFGARLATRSVEVTLSHADASLHGSDETPRLRDLAAACPDPALHEAAERAERCESTSVLSPSFPCVLERGHDLHRNDQGVNWAVDEDQWNDLKTELLETHADLEASRAREQIAQGRIAAAVVILDGLGPAPTGWITAQPTLGMLRAILAGDPADGASGGEER